MSRGRDDGNDTWKRLSTFFHVSAAESTSSLTTAVASSYGDGGGGCGSSRDGRGGGVAVAVMAMVVMAMVDGCGGRVLGRCVRATHHEQSREIFSETAEFHPVVLGTMATSSIAVQLLGPPVLGVVSTERI